MTRRRLIRDLGTDANGRACEEWEFDGQPVIVHHDDIPESDITSINGLRVTTALRTAIDLATSLSRDELDRLVRDFMGRGLFTRDEARARLTRPDLRTHPGARILHAHLRL